MQNDDPLGVRVPGTHYKAYLVASLALTSTRDAAIQHYKLTAEEVEWAEEWYLANGPEIYDAIAEARRIGDELGAEVRQIALEKLRGNDDPEALLAIEAERTLFGVSMALEHETRLLVTVAERYNVEKPLMIRAESKMLVGRPLVFLYDAADGHRLSDYRELARALHDVMGHPVCLLNRARIIDDMDEGWTRQLDLASYLSQVIVPTEAGDDAGGQSK